MGFIHKKLTLTIIVLIILSGITILSLNNTKLFSKTTESTEKYKIAKQDEQNTLNEYNSYISNNSRENITIDKTEYEKIKLLNKPNLWEVCKEYDFGDGVFGQRFAGEGDKTYTRHWKTIGTITNLNTLINLGGYIKDSSNEVRYINMIYNDSQGGDENFDAAYSELTCSSSTGKISYVWENVNAYIDIYYDIWILYTKN